MAQATYDVGGTVGEIPEWVMEEACRTGYVPPGPWAGEGYNSQTDQITLGVAQQVLAACEAYRAARSSPEAMLKGVPGWALALGAGVGLWLWLRR